MRRCVYHKNFDPKGSEKERCLFTKVIQTDKELEDLGPDWGEHPSLIKIEKKPQAKKLEKAQ